MRQALPRRPFSPALAIAIVAAGLSCNGPGTNPRASDAKASLQSALEAWRDDKRPGDLASATPPIHVVDGEWTSGRKLSSFQILREEPSETDKRFAVRLVLAPPAGEDDVIYIVLGSDPVSVYRDADFERTMNMDNNPVPKKKRR